MRNSLNTLKLNMYLLINTFPKLFKIFPKTYYQIDVLLGNTRYIALLFTVSADSSRQVQSIISFADFQTKILQLLATTVFSNL